MKHKLKHLIDWPPVGFTLAFQKKIDRSLIGYFLNRDVTMTMEELWCYIIPMKLYDSDHLNDEAKTCFLDKNSVTDNCLKMIKKSVIAKDRQVLWDEFKKVAVLRCLFAKVILFLFVQLSRRAVSKTANLSA